MSILPSELLRGTLDLMILKTLTRGPQHGWAIAQTIRLGSGGVFDVNQGSLYPALHRMKRRGWVTAEWRNSESGRRARFYTLTAAGCSQLAEEELAWTSSKGALDRLLAWA